MDNMIKTKHLRVSTTKEEKQTLEHLLQNESMPTEEEIKDILGKLTSEWNIQRVKRYWNNNRKNK